MMNATKKKHMYSLLSSLGTKSMPREAVAWYMSAAQSTVVEVMKRVIKASWMLSKDLK